ncbi:MAG: hypothetical protein RLZZ436_1812 [Planctomycetota bacterium]
MVADASESIEDSSSHSITIMLRRIQQGELAEVDRLLERLYADTEFGRMMRTAYGKLGSGGERQEAAEDVMQETMKELLRRARRGKLEDLDGRQRLFGLLRLIVAEKARDYRRGQNALKRGGNEQIMSLNNRSVDDSESHAMQDFLDDPAAADDREMFEVRDLYLKLLERLRQIAPNPELCGRVIEGLLDDRGESRIAKETGMTRTQVGDVIRLIRRIAKQLYGHELENLKKEFPDEDGI